MSSHGSRGRSPALAVALCLVTAGSRVSAQGPAPLAPGTAPASVPSVLTLDQALRLTRERNVNLRASELMAQAAQERTRDANRLPNPSLAAGMENYGGSLGSARAESWLLLGQTLELGGDRGARAGLARSLATLSAVDRDRLLRLLEAETIETFCDAWVLQERAKRLAEAERAAERAIAASEERLKAGAAPAVERTRAESYRWFRRIEHRRAVAELGAARRFLVAQWGADTVAFDSLALPDPIEFTLPPLEELLPRIDAHPERRRAAAESAVEGWRVRQAEAARVPDPGLEAGARHLSEVGGTGWAVGLSVPLPFWNSQRGGLDAARAEQAAARAREQQTELRLSADLHVAYDRYAASTAIWQDVKDRVRPSAEESMRLVLSGYRSGRLGYLDIQEAHRSLTDAELLFIESSADVWRTRNALERLLGTSLETTAPGEERP